MSVLYAIAMVILTIYGMNLLWLAVKYVAKSRLRQGAVPEMGALPDMHDAWPVVTVQLPLYNEALVAERLIDACATMRYPKELLEIQVLDDSTDETREIVAKRVAYWQGQGVDIVQIHRVDRTGYKAGALKNGLADVDHVATATASMKQLNKAAAGAAIAASAHAMPDITGFGLLGHAHEMAHHGDVSFVFEADKLPWLPGAIGYGERGIFPGGKGRNLMHFTPHVRFADNVSDLYQDMLWTPETSGGLLIALAPGDLDQFQSEFGDVAVVGTVEPAGAEARIKVI